jgi:transposase
MSQGRAGIKRDLPLELQGLADRLPAVLIDTLREQFSRINELDAQIAGIERRLRQWHQQDAASQRIAAIPRVGLLTATAAIATLGEAQAFKSGREFAAWLGLVPRQSGTGGAFGYRASVGINF